MTFNPIDPNHYRFWKQSLVNKAAGLPIEVPVDQPQPGYYGLHTKDGLLPVAIWYRADESFACRVNNQPAQQSVKALWTSVGGNPVTEEAYKERVAEGKWPEEAVATNRAPSDESVIAQIDQLASEADGLLAKEAKTQAEADKLQSYVANLRALKTKAEAEHKAEKAPWLEGGRIVDNKFFPAIGRADETVKRLLKKIGDFLRAQQAKVTEVMAANPGVAVEKPKAGAQNIVGGKKRATTLREVTTAEIVEPAIAAAHYCNNPKILELVNALALKEYAASGKEPPGVKIHKTQEAR